MIIETWFPIAIYKEENLLSPEQNKEIANYLLSIQPKIKSGGETWIGDTYTTNQTYNLYRDPHLRPLCESIEHHVNYFAKVHKSDAIYRCTNAWFNINVENTFQEYHFHGDSVFSCAYYVSVPDQSGDIIFEDLKNSGERQINFKDDVDVNDPSNFVWSIVIDTNGMNKTPSKGYRYGGLVQAKREFFAPLI